MVFDIEIDPNELDVEWLKQPQIFLTVSRESADAKAETARVKLALEVVEAELLQDIRLHPEKYDLQKTTEGAISEAMKNTEKYQAARTALIDAQHESDIMSAAVAAFDQRKRALECLVTLHGQQYFAGPSAPRDIDKAWAADVEKTAVRSKGRRKKDSGGGDE